MTTNPDKEKQRERTKMMLLQKIKKLKIKSQGAPSVASFNSQPVRLQNPDSFLNDAKPLKQVKINKIEESEKDRSEMRDQIEVDDQNKKYKNQEGYKEEVDKEVKKSIKFKRPYYQHYSKEGVFEPVLDYVRNHPNPSGKPDNIPPQMYEGIQVVPKRPWVFFGPQNIPPSDCQQINETVFSQIFAEAKKNKGSGLLKRSNKKKNMKRSQDEISQVSDEFTSNFTFSDSVDLSKESDLISEFRSQTKTYKVYDSSNVDQSEVNDEFSSMSGSVTQRHRYNLFDSSDSQKQQSSMEASKRRRKFKKLLQSSDDQPDKSSMNRPSSAMFNSESQVNPFKKIADKDSSAKVEIDQNSSSVSKSMSRSKSRSQMKPAAQNMRVTRNKKIKIEKSESESD